MSETDNNSVVSKSASLDISSGVDYIKNGYIEYAQEVITGRALPNLYDGLKPVNRRTIYTLKESKHKGNIKSARLAGDVLALHPHGDTSVYSAFVLMTDRNGSLAFPLLKGTGTFGGVYKTDPPAASRYTEVALHKNAEEYFGQMDGINMIPNFDSTMMEPEVLPVSFPAVLVNSTSGIAVGFRSNIPSFNFNDVCDLVIECIEDGSCHTVIEPDFVTGGYYIRNEKELQKLMRTGKAKLKLRGRAFTHEKKIKCTEIPFGKTMQGIIKQINNSNISSIRNAYDTDDFERDSLFTVDCTAKTRVDEAMYAIIKDTDFQYTYSADITVVDNGIPKRLGVWDIIPLWIEWRKGVLKKSLGNQIEDCKQSMREANAFMCIVNNFDKRTELINIINKSGRQAGIDYIRNNFTRDEVPDDLIKFCATRNIDYYHDGGKYKDLYDKSKAVLDELEADFNNLDAVIIREMKRLKATYGVNLQRKTEVTTTDYTFSEDGTAKEQKIDASACVYTFKDGFLKKLRYSVGDNVQYEFDGFANDVLIAFDNRGRLLRVYCQDLPLNSASDMGVYLPRYFGFNETDDYRIKWIGRMDGKELMLLYTDGNVSFVDTSEWADSTRNVKVLEKGIPVSIADKLGAVVTDVKDMLFVTEDKGRIAWVYTDDIKRKHRTAKTRVFNPAGTTFIDSYAVLDKETGTSFLRNIGHYKNKFKKLEYPDSFRGSLDDLTLMF